MIASSRVNFAVPICRVQILLNLSTDFDLASEQVKEVQVYYALPPLLPKDERVPVGRNDSSNIRDYERLLPRQVISVLFVHVVLGVCVPYEVFIY